MRRGRVYAHGHAATGRFHARLAGGDVTAAGTWGVKASFKKKPMQLVSGRFGGGRDSIAFTVVAGAHMRFGVIWPGFDVEGQTPAFAVDAVHGHCFYATFNGRHFPSNPDWEGRQAAKEQGDRIGMLLDLDQGSMSIWKNGERLGVMQAGGLTGPLCWAASVGLQGDSARIESAPVPAPAAVDP